MSALFSYLVLGTTRGLIYGILALGLVLVYKGTRVLNLAQPFFGLLGAFSCWWLTAEAHFLPFAARTRPRCLVALLVTVLVVGVLGAALERWLFTPLQRVGRLVALVATLAVGQGIVGLIAVVFQRDRRQAEAVRTIPTFVHGVVHLGHVNLTGGDLQVLVIVPLVALELGLFLKLARFGVAIRAAAENRDSARLLGISADAVTRFSWVAGLVLAALAGVLLASSQGSLSVSTLSTGFLVRALAAALIGGLTSSRGALVGGLAVGIAEAVISGVFRNTVGAADAVFFVVVVALLLVRPQGIFGTREEGGDHAALLAPSPELAPTVAASPFVPLVRRIAIGTAVAFALAVSWATGAATNGTLVLVSVGAMVGVSLVVLMGQTGQISLGHWALVGVGAFGAGHLSRLGVPFLAIVPLAVLMGMGVSLLIGLPALRIRGLHLAVVTLTFGYAAHQFVFRSALVGGAQTGVVMHAPRLGPIALDAASKRPLFAFSLLLLLGCLWVARNVLGSRTGRTFLALRENEKAAATLGIPLARARLTAFAMSGGIASLAGVVFALRVGTVNAADFPTETSLALVLMAVIGGLGALSGSFLGALALFGLPVLLHFDNGWVVPLGTGFVTVLVIVRVQGGLAGLVLAARRRILTSLVDIDGRTAPVAGRASGGGGDTSSVPVPSGSALPAA